jgi:hypothetical protein
MKLKTDKRKKIVDANLISKRPQQRASAFNWSPSGKPIEYKTDVFRIGKNTCNQVLHYN